MPRHSYNPYQPPIPREDLVKLLGKPLTIQEFIESIEGEVEISPVQKQDLIESLGEGALFGDPHKFFDGKSRPTLSVFLWGKGGGKGTVTSIAMLYMVHLMHYLLPNPASYFGLSFNDPLSIVIVSTNEDQAIEILSRRIRPRIEGCPFFNQFPIVVASSNMKKPPNSSRFRPEFANEPIIIKGKEIEFSFIKTVIYSVPSRNESFEGKTVIGFIMDEASGHMSTRGKPNAQKIFDTLTTSTRNLPYLGYITSYPRETKNKDFTYKKHVEIVKEKMIPNAFSTRRAAWEANPRLYEEAGDKTFRIEVKDKDFAEVIDVPDIPSLRKAFERDFNTAVSRYVALPLGEARPAWISIFENVNIDYFIDKNRFPVVKFKSGVSMMENRSAGYKVEIESIDSSGALLFPYFLGVDLGESDCQAAVTLAHAIVQQGFPLLVIDAILVWKPDRTKGIVVNFPNLFDVITRLIKEFNIRHAKSDAWQSAYPSSLIENWDKKPAGYEEYNLLKSLISNNPPLIRFPNQLESYEALSQLKDLHTPTSERTKPKVSSGNYQDVADSIACAVGVFSKLFEVDPETLAVKIQQQDEGTREEEGVPIAFVEKDPLTTPLQVLVPPQTRGYTGEVPGRIIVGKKTPTPIIPTWIRNRSF